MVWGRIVGETLVIEDLHFFQVVGFEGTKLPPGSLNQLKQDISELFGVNGMIFIDTVNRSTGARGSFSGQYNYIPLDGK